MSFEDRNQIGRDSVLRVYKMYKYSSLERKIQVEVNRDE